MKILCIDTTRKSAQILIFNTENDYKYILSMDEKIKHSEGLFLYLEKALFESKINLSDFDYLCGVVGPGSFTGIRVGMSVLKGINKSIKKCLLPINAFEVFSNEMKAGIILLNSTSTSCYFAEIKNGEILSDGVIQKSQINEKFGGKKIYILKEEQNIINIEYDNIVQLEDLSDMYYKSIIYKISSGIKEEFVPYYLQLSQAERNLKNE